MRSVVVTSLACGAALAVTACAHEDLAGRQELVCAAPVQHYDWAARAAEAPASQARPRLAETRTLGANDPAYTDARLQDRTPVVVAAGAPPQPVVQQYFGGGYAPVARYGFAAPVRSPSSWESMGGGRSASPSGGTPPLGGNWAAPPAYGPRFPFSTGPANPWR